MRSMTLLAGLLLPALPLLAQAPAARAADGPTLSSQLPEPCGELLLPATGYDPAIPSLTSVCGHRFGERHTRPEQIVRVFEAIGAASARVAVGHHGRTVEGRPLLHAVVTSPENHAHLEALRAEHLRMATAGPEESPSRPTPIIVYMGYGVHGNESSAHEAAVLTLWHLAAGTGPRIEDFLERAVVVIDPSLNPDGHDRFVDWVNGNRGAHASSDREDRERRQPWPSGRTNHWLFDLNRDWVPLVHEESRHRMELWQSWRPHLSLDFHEMGGRSTFFFQPGIPSRNNPLTPEPVHALTRKIAAFHARALDRVGQLYFTREVYDDYYYGKGSTYADLNGAVGILFEQASSRGLLAATDGGPLSYARTIRNQFVTSLSSLAAAEELSTELKAWQRTFHAEAAAFAARQETAAWLFPLEGQRDRVAELVALLARHRIRAHRHTEREDVILVPTDQPQARLVVALLDEVREVPDRLFYDVTTWPLPQAFGLRFEKLPGRIEDLVGARVEAEELREKGGATAAAEGAVAWIVPWSRSGTTAFLHGLYAEGAIVRYARRAGRVRCGEAELSFAPGSLVVPVDQPASFAPRDRCREKLLGLLEALGRRHGVPFTPATSALALDGIDLGSPSLPVLTPPRLALVGGRSTSSYRHGEVWHHLSEVCGMQIVRLTDERLGSAALGAYDVIVVPGGDLDEVMGKDDVAHLRAWVRRGGTLVVLADACRWASRHGLGPKGVAPAPIQGEAESYGARRRFRGERSMGGSVFEARLDLSHPLTFGLPERVALFRVNTLRIPPGRATDSPARYTSEPLISGYAHPDTRAALAGSSALTATRVGRGRVILAPDALAFRGFWKGSARLLTNAVHFGRSF